MEVHDHNYTGLDRDAEQRDVAHPDSHTEVVAEQPLQDQAARHGIEGWENQHRCFRYGMEDHVEQQEDHEEHNRQDDLEPRFGSQLELVLAGPMIGESCRQRELLAQLVRGVVDESSVVFCVQVNVDVTGKLAFLVTDHGWAARERNFGHLLNRDLRSGRSGNQNPPQLLNVVAEISLIAHVDWIPLAPLDVLLYVHAADS